MIDLLNNPWVHHVITLIHICAALFWMGWIVFIFVLLMPVVQRNIPSAVEKLMPALKQRVRRVVFWLILLIAATGLYNMYYRGLFDTEVLLYSAYGRRFLLKLGAALILFSVYVAAPYLTGGKASGAEEGCCDQDEDSSGNMVGVVLHIIAFASGMVAALIGISLGA